MILEKNGIIMQVVFENRRVNHAKEIKKIDTDEEVVRWELVRVWMKILDKYARPGAHIPSADEVRRELLEKGVNAAVKAVADEHWFVFTWMIRDEIHQKVESGLNSFDLQQFLDDVKRSQNDPELLRRLRNEIKNHVLF